ncbi:MAG: twin-arginine translocase subunit TatC [Chloroflexi bacterium]|nr:twin-arginine translocase subunit TatC [Chloroflexota bacterium]
MPPDTKLTLMGHILELRRRMMYSAVAVVITTVLSFVFTEQIMRVLLRPAGGIKPIFTEMQEMFSTYIKVALVSGVVLAMPFLIYQLIMFIAPALTLKEKRFLFSVLPGIMLAFAAGVLFGYFVLLPPAVEFLLSFGSDIATPQIKIGNYISVVTTLLFWIGVCFELPVVLFFLAKLHVVSAQKLAKARPFAFILAFIIGAAVTPTSDPINQALVSVPIMILYEIGILLARLAWRGPKQQTAAAAKM